MSLVQQAVNYNGVMLRLCAQSWETAGQTINPSPYLSNRVQCNRGALGLTIMCVRGLGKCIYLSVILNQERPAVTQVAYYHSISLRFRSMSAFSRIVLNDICNQQEIFMQMILALIILSSPKAHTHNQVKPFVWVLEHLRLQLRENWDFQEALMPKNSCPNKIT